MALQNISTIERRIITAYLDRVAALALEREIRVTVRDEEEAVYIGNFDRSQIEAQIGDTDFTKIRVTVSDTERHTTLFIHGNEEDVVSDSGFTEAGEWLDDRLLKGISE